MGGVLAELIAKAGHDVTLVTPAALVQAWTLKALDQPFVHRRLVDCGVTLRLNSQLTACRAARVELACAYPGPPAQLDCAARVLVTADRLSVVLGKRVSGSGHDGGRRNINKKK